MARTEVTSEQLAEIMTSRLQEYEGCEEITVGQPVRLAEADETGCNWSDGLIVSSGGVPFAVYKNALGQVVHAAREEFNLQ
jgi:hypothetical protein